MSMATKYSGSLDVGEELDEENKRPPVIDDDDGEETPSAEDDFNDLIRRELGDITPQPKKKEAEVKIEPAKEVPKVEEIKIEKPAPKPIRVKEVPKIVPKFVKPEPKIVKAEVKKEVPKVKEVVKVKKETPKPTPKPVPKVMPKAPKVVKAELRKAEKSEPKREVKQSSGTRWLTLLILLLVAAGAVYAVHALRTGKDDAALGCAMSYASQKNGVSLAWKDANAVEQYWLKSAYESTSELEAARIFHMLACPDAFLSTLSDPAGYLNCKTPVTYVLIDQQTLDENPIAAFGNTTVLTKLNTGKASKNFILKYQLTTPLVSAWEVKLNTTKK